MPIKVTYTNPANGNVITEVELAAMAKVTHYRDDDAPDA